MALSDLAVFNEQVYLAKTEVLAQQIELFNAASGGTIVLRQAANQGDYTEEAYWAKISGLVRRRNAYGTGAVTKKVMSHLTDVSVKIAAGTPPVELNPGMLKWIKSSPDAAGAALGQQLAKDAMADMLNTSLIGTVGAIANVGATVVSDKTGATPDNLTTKHLNDAAYLFGDAAASILAWVLHSTPMKDFYGEAIDNAESLFTYGTINVKRDPFGRIFVVTDASGLVTTGSPDVYNVLGLTAGAIEIEENDDYTENTETNNGDENILRTYQAEWSYNLSLKGYAWDKTNGGHSPNNNALATGTNWDKIATSHKDTAGVLLKVNAA